MELLRLLSGLNKNSNYVFPYYFEFNRYLCSVRGGPVFHPSVNVSKVDSNTDSRNDLVKQSPRPNGDPVTAEPVDGDENYAEKTENHNRPVCATTAAADGDIAQKQSTADGDVTRSDAIGPASRVDAKATFAVRKTDDDRGDNVYFTTFDRLGIQPNEVFY